MTEPSFVEIAAQLASLAYHDLQIRDLPATIHIDLTYRCDLDCEHCYLDTKTDWPELTTSELLDVVNQAHALGVHQLTWSGGEPFARSDFRELVEHATKLGLSNRIKTHAGNIDDEVAGWLARQSLSRVEVSVYSLNERLHDAVTRVPGSLRATLDGIAAMRRAGVRVTVSWVATPSNIEEALDLHRYFGRLGCFVSFGVGIQPDNAASTDLADLDLGEDDLVRAYAQLQRQRLDRGEEIAVRRLDGDAGPCGAGRRMLYVAPDGSVTPCVVFPATLGNLHEQSLADIWHNSPLRREIADWTNKDRSSCMSCGAGGNCFYCPGEAYKRTGDFRVAPPEFHTRTRAKMRSFEIVHGERFDDAFWASIPDDGPAPPKRERKAVFPILRPQKGRRGA